VVAGVLFVVAVIALVLLGARFFPEGSPHRDAFELVAGLVVVVVPVLPILVGRALRARGR
jgi:hypothetical protein